MVTHQQHGEGICDCPKLRIVGWIGPAPTGWHEPVLLIVPRSPESAQRLRDTARRAGLRLDLVRYADATEVHLDGHRATMTLGKREIGPVDVPPEWTELAREHAEIVLMLGTMTLPEDMDMDAYLDRHGDGVITGLVPVAGLTTHRRCPAKLPSTDLVSDLVSDPVPARRKRPREDW